MRGAIQLLEFVQHTGSLQVDEAAGVVRGVRVLGLESANGRTYTREAVTKARGLYEGKQVNIDHPARPNEQTSVARRFGWLEGVRQDPDGGLRADLHFLKSHPLAAAVIEAAQRRPQLLGLSHNAQGTSSRQDGRDVIEAIDAVHSVDLVADPATVAGLHESRGTQAVKKKLRDLIESLKGKRPGYARGLREMAESGLMSPDQDADEPGAMGSGKDGYAAGDPEEAGDHEAALKQGFAAACSAVLADDGMDLKAKLAKLKDILTAQEKLLGGDKPAETPADKGPDVEESKKLRLENAGLKLLLEAGVRPGKVLTKALAGCADEAEMRALIEESRAAPAGKPGAKSGGAPDGAGAAKVQEAKAPDDPKRLKSWLQE